MGFKHLSSLLREQTPLLMMTSERQHQLSNLSQSEKARYASKRDCTPTEQEPVSNVALSCSCPSSKRPVNLADHIKGGSRMWHSYDDPVTGAEEIRQTVILTVLARNQQPAGRFSCSGISSRIRYGHAQEHTRLLFEHICDTVIRIRGEEREEDRMLKNLVSA